MDDRIVFGIHAVESLVKRKSEQIERLLVQKGRNDKRVTDLVELAGKKMPLSAEIVERKVLDNLCQGRHQGVIAIIGQQQDHDEGDLEALLQSLSHPPLLLVLDGVTDPHNLGACMRSANAAGVDAVIVPKDKSATLTPVARKVASGAAEETPFIRVTNLARTLKWLQQYGVWLVGAAGEAEGLIYDQSLTGAIAIVMGNEGKGMRRLTRENCDSLIKIPMAGEVSSLNVSVATGVCLFEAVRQRRAGK